MPFVVAHPWVDLGLVASLVLHARMDSVDLVYNIDSLMADEDTLDSHIGVRARIEAHSLDSIDQVKIIGDVQMRYISLTFVERKLPAAGMEDVEDIQLDNLDVVDVASSLKSNYVHSSVYYRHFYIKRNV